MKIRDIVLAVIILGLLWFTFIPVEVAEEKGGAAFGTMEKTGQQMLGQPTPETATPETAE